jgi:hypothetical protein
VHGFIKAGSTVAKAPTAQIDLGIMEHADRQLDEYHWSVTFPRTPGPDQKGTAGGAPLDLKASRYGNVVVPAGATLVLHAGAYYLESLDVQGQAIVEIDNSYGPVYLWVRSSFGMSGTMVLYRETPNVLWGYAGTAAPRIETAFHGTLVAPRADVTLPAAAQNHTGAFFAHSITVGDGAIIEHQPFQSADVDYSAAPDYGECFESEVCHQEPSAAGIAACQYQYTTNSNSCSTGGLTCSANGLGCTALVEIPPAFAACLAAVGASCYYQQVSCNDNVGSALAVCMTQVQLVQVCNFIEICPM